MAGLPDLTGMTMQDATRQLADMSISWRYEGDPTVHGQAVRPATAGTAIAPSEAEDVVVGQKPPAGELYDKNTIVILATRCSRLDPAEAACA